MSGIPSDPDDELIVRALTDGPDAVARLCQERADLVPRVRELQALEGRIDLASAARERDALRVTDADRERARVFVRGRLADAKVVSTPVAEPSPRHARRPRWLALAAALFVVFAAVALWRARGPESGPRRILLGGDAVKLSESEGGFELTWKPAGERYLVRVERVAPTPDGTTLLFERKLSETRWSPTLEERATWPERVRVSVAVIDASGQSTASLGWAEFSLSPR